MRIASVGTVRLRRACANLRKSSTNWRFLTSPYVCTIMYLIEVAGIFAASIFNASEHLSPTVYGDPIDYLLRKIEILWKRLA